MKALRTLYNQVTGKVDTEVENTSKNETSKFITMDSVNYANEVQKKREEKINQLQCFYNQFIQKMNKTKSDFDSSVFYKNIIIKFLSKVCAEACDSDRNSILKELDINYLDMKGLCTLGAEDNIKSHLSTKLNGLTASDIMIKLGKIDLKSDSKISVADQVLNRIKESISLHRQQIKSAKTQEELDKENQISKSNSKMIDSELYSAEYDTSACKENTQKAISNMKELNDFLNIYYKISFFKNTSIDLADYDIAIDFNNDKIILKSSQKKDFHGSDEFYIDLSNKILIIEQKNKLLIEKDEKIIEDLIVCNPDIIFYDTYLDNLIVFESLDNKILKSAEIKAFYNKIFTEIGIDFNCNKLQLNPLDDEKFIDSITGFMEPEFTEAVSNKEFQIKLIKKHNPKTFDDKIIIINSIYDSIKITDSIYDPIKATMLNIEYTLYTKINLVTCYFEMFIISDILLDNDITENKDTTENDCLENFSSEQVYIGMTFEIQQEDNKENELKVKIQTNQKNSWKNTYFNKFIKISQFDKFINISQGYSNNEKLNDFFIDLNNEDNNFDNNVTSDIAPFSYEFTLPLGNLNNNSGNIELNVDYYNLGLLKM